MHEQQSQRRFKWGALPLKATEEEAERAFSAVERAFNPHWLAGNQGNRVQEVWARNDFLAGVEIFNLGRAVQAVDQLDNQKMKQLASAIRKAGKGAHGFLYEVQAIAMLAQGGSAVLPTKNAAPGCDAIINFKDGTTFRWSIKNHDQSDREKAFRNQCARIYAGHRTRAQPGALERLLVLSDVEIDAVVADRVLKAWPQLLGHWHDISPGVRAVRARLQAPRHEPPYAHDGLSTQLTVTADQPSHEQSGFTKKLAAALANMGKHCPRAPQYVNAILMRVHASADTASLKASAEELLEASDCAVDAVLFHQPAVTRSDDSWSIVHHIQAAIGPRYPHAYPIKIVLPSGLVLLCHK